MVRPRAIDEHLRHLAGQDLNMLLSSAYRQRHQFVFYQDTLSSCNPFNTGELDAFYNMVRTSQAGL